MRMILFSLIGLAAAAVIEIQAAAAQQEVSAWCAEMYDKTNECSFRSRPQCEVQVSGLGGFCYENPAYNPAKRVPR